MFHSTSKIPEHNFSKSAVPTQSYTGINSNRILSPEVPFKEESNPVINQNFIEEERQHPNINKQYFNGNGNSTDKFDDSLENYRPGVTKHASGPALTITELPSYELIRREVKTVDFPSFNSSTVQYNDPFDKLRSNNNINKDISTPEPLASTIINQLKRSQGDNKIPAFSTFTRSNEVHHVLNQGCLPSSPFIALKNIFNRTDIFWLTRAGIEIFSKDLRSDSLCLYNYHGGPAICDPALVPTIMLFEKRAPEIQTGSSRQWFSKCCNSSSPKEPNDALSIVSDDMDVRPKNTLY